MMVEIKKASFWQALYRASCITIHVEQGLFPFTFPLISIEDTEGAPTKLKTQSDEGYYPTIVTLNVFKETPRIKRSKKE